MATINGIGTRLLNCTRPDENGICEAYWWITFLYLPIYPIKKVSFVREFSPEQTWEFREIERLNKSSKEILWTLLKFLCFYPVLIFWPMPFAVTEVYHGLGLPENLYNGLVFFAIAWLGVIVLVLASRYEKMGLPDNYRQIMKQQEEEIIDNQS